MQYAADPPYFLCLILFFILFVDTKIVSYKTEEQKRTPWIAEWVFCVTVTASPQKIMLT